MRIGRAVILVALLAAPVAVGQPPVPGPPLGPPAVAPKRPRNTSFPWAALLPSWVMIAVVIYTQQQTRTREEEEEVSTPTDGLEFEYKIVRSATALFKKPEKFRAVLEEEGRVGWQLVEKFDDTRMRLRRSVSWRERDADSDQDPYRIRVGISESALGARIALVILGMLLLIGVAIGLLVYFNK